MFRPSVRVLLAAVVVSACHCGPALEVVAASPEGPQDPAPRLVRFLLNRPLYDASQPLPADLQAPQVRVTPTVAVRAAIISPTSVDVEFAQPLAPAQSFEVALLSGLATVDGRQKLGQERAVRFTTPVNRPTSLAVFDAGGQEVSGSAVNVDGKVVSALVRLGPEEGLALSFAFPVAASQLSLIQLFVRDGAQVDAKVTRDEADPRRVRIAPAPKWPRDAPLVLSVSAGLRVDQPGAGSLVSTRPFAFDLRTWGDLSVTGPDTRNACLGSRTLPVTFSNPVSCEVTLGHVALDLAGREVKCVTSATGRLQRYELVPMPPADAPVTLTVSPGLRDAFGEVTSTPLSFTFQPCEASVQFAYTKPFVILDPGQNAEAVERLHGSHALKVEGVKVAVDAAWNVLRKQGLTDQVAWTELPWWIQYGVWDEEGGGGDIGVDQKLPGEFDGTVIDALAGAKSVTLPVPGAKEWNDVAIPLAPFLGGRKGLVLLRETPLSPAGKPNGRPVLRVANVTDIGLSARLSPEKLVLLAAGYADGQPMADVHIRVKTEDGKALGEGTTGRDGLLMLPVTQLAGLGRLGVEQLLLVATKGDDEAFLWTRFIVDPNYGDDAPQLLGLAYTDRGIYRPGEHGHFRAVMRYGSARGFDSVAGQKGRFALYDPEGTLEASADVTVSPFGTLEQPIDIKANARVGTWNATLTLGAGTLSATFEVGEFRRAEMKVEIQAPPRLARGETLTAMVHGDYLFGAPASGQRLSWSLLRSGSAFESKLAPEARFATPGADEWSWGSAPMSTLAEGATTLDDKGSFTLERKLDLPNPVAQHELLTLSATVEDANGQSVSRLAQVELFAAKVVVGLVADRYLAEAGKPHTATAVALTPDDKVAANTPVRVLTRESGWRSVRRTGPGGGAYWTSERVEKPEQLRCTGTTDAKGRFACTFSPSSSGSLQVIAEARDAAGHAVRTGAWRWVWGGSEAWGAGGDDPKVDVRFDRDTINAGEQLEVAIGSPFPHGLALVTVEREEVLWQKVVPVGPGTRLSIPTDPSWAPNVHVVATVVSGRQKPGQRPDPDQEKPRYAIGRRIANVKPAGRRLDVKVAAAKERLEPGQEQVAVVTVTGEGGRPAAGAEVNLWAVDEGVLMLTGYRTPDLLAALYATRGYRSLGLDTRAYVLGKRLFVEPVAKGEEDGGGGGLGEGDLTRRNFDPLAVWVGSVITDASGRVESKFKVPDNLTTYRVMAVAVTKDDRFGQGQGAFKVNKPLMLRQALSRFARPGDKLRVGVLVNQLTGAAGTATVTLDRVDERLFEVGSPRSVEVRVEQGATVPVLFDLSAKDVEGASELVFAASMGSHKDRVELKLPVKRQAPRETVAASGVVSSGTFRGTLTLPDGARAESLELNVSGFPLSAMEPRLREMVEYPYGCLEQRTSRILPLLAIRELGQQLKMASIPGDRIKGWVEEYLALVPKFRCANDGFDYWPGCRFGASTVLTSFALEGMLTARKYGFDVPQTEIDKTVGFLRQMVREGSQGRDQYGGDGLVDYAFVGALRMLAEAGQPEPELERVRFDARAQLPLFGKTELVRAMAKRLGKDAAKDPAVKTLLAEIGAKGRQGASGLTYDAEDPVSHWQAWESPQRNTAVVLHTLAEVTPTDGRIPLLVKGLVDLDAANPWYVTSDTTQTLLALADAVPLMNRNAKLSAGVSAAGRKLGDETFGAAVKSWSLPGDGLSGAIPLEIANTGEGPLFFGAFLKYAWPAAARLPPAANGFVMNREYLGRDGKPLTVDAGDGSTPLLKLKVGDLVRVRIRVKADEGGRLVVFEDPLPAGLEAVDAKLATSDAALLSQMEEGESHWWEDYHRELRDDRVEWHFDQIGRGEFVLTYVARATTAGTFYAPGSRGERMYQPQVNGRSAGLVVQVAPAATKE